MAPHFTKHALKRMAEMEVTSAEVLHVLSHAEQTYPNAKGHAPGTIHQLGDIAVVTAEDTGNIMTVLYRTTEEYRRP